MARTVSDTVGRYCFTKSCSGRFEEVDIKEEHKESSSHGAAHFELKAVAECDSCSATTYEYY